MASWCQAIWMRLRYGPLVLTAGAIMLVAIWASAAGTWRYIPRLSKASPGQERMSPITLLKSIGETLKNRNYLVLVIGFFFFMITSGIYDTLEVFMFTYFWELVPEQIRWLKLVGAPSAMTGALLSPILMRKYDRKPVMIDLARRAVLFAQLMVDLRLLGLMFENGDPALLPFLLVNRAGFAFSLGVSTVVMLSMIGDIIDDNELRTGERQEGLFYSARAFFAKASSSFGHFFAGVVLDLYIRMPFEAVPGQLDEQVLHRLGIIAGPVMALSAVISLFVYSRYNLSRERIRRSRGCCSRGYIQATDPSESNHQLGVRVQSALGSIPTAAADFSKSITHSERALWAVRADLSYQPENPRLSAAERLYSRATIVYPYADRAQDYAAEVKKRIAKMKKRGIGDGIAVYQQVMGNELPAYGFLEAGKSEIDYLMAGEKFNKKMSAEFEAFSRTVRPMIRRIEYLSSTAMPDLGYTP